ncbi:type II toxin-antitoxin system VapC family toxin [Corynebacterium coyleae]|uniref:type II toxin-antitoxin system VapC family toxin n=1 Tax=Corynebacterium coyleae TaxID=53374 RepID=UPI000C761260|nr:type II toxin-antitoxin system VapC family toxin [Corynebacterium coyleae]PLA27045.1 VapC toxin family PIN domain ribonuclease [Corynebacterium coyleae]
MIILDTNVVSELCRKAPHENVKRWAATTDPKQCITSITVGEIVRGVRSLPSGARRNEIQHVVFWQLSNFEQRNGVLAFDTDAAWAFGEIVVERKRMGRPIHDADAMIAAICRAHDAPLATRNLKDFEGTDVTLVDPWEGA